MDAVLPALVGREEELEALDALLRADALPASLLVAGEAGIGKTSLCLAAVELARERGFETLAARPAEAEAELSFASVGDLLGPVLDRVLGELPAPQARALRVALLVEEGEAAPDARALGVAFLGALRVLSRDQPVLLAVDDVQWLDSSSAAVLSFVGRRLATEPIALVLARRAGHGDDVVPALDHVTRLDVCGLSVGAVHRLLRERLELALPRPALRRLHELSAGNPFYALELGRAFAAGALRLERGESLPPTLDVLVGHRVAALPAETRDALAAAAALARPLMSLVGQQRVLGPAVDAGVVTLAGDEIRFAHPLLASAALSAVAPEERRVLHARLAARVADPEERARHRALAADAPDDAVAAELEAAANGARRRGGAATAAELAERAVALTATVGEARERRTLLVARARLEAGDAGGARRTVEELLDSTVLGPSRAQALADLARICMFVGARRRAVALLRDVLEQTDDTRLRALAEERLVTTLTVLREDLHEARQQALVSVQRAERLGDPNVLVRALAALGFVGGVLGDPAAPAVLERGRELEPSSSLARVERPSYNLAGVQMWRGDLGAARAEFVAVYREAAEAGDEGSLAWTADNLAQLEFLAGNWDDALAWARRGDDLAAQTGQPAQRAYARAVRAVVLAHRGAAAEAREAAQEALELSGDEVAIGWLNARWALGALELSLGDAAAAHEALERACAHVEREQIGEPGTIRFVFEDVEALIALGEAAAAERRLASVEAHAQRLGRVFALAAAARCRGLLAAAAGDTEAALKRFEQALALHERDPYALDRARTLHTYGVTLRRAKRRRGARSALEQAEATFEELGAAAFAARTRDELARIGGRTASGGALTHTERKIAELAAQGLSNREIAAAAFVTTKTVEFHLRNIFRKLGVRSRTQLARRAF